MSSSEQMIKDFKIENYKIDDSLNAARILQVIMHFMKLMRFEKMQMSQNLSRINSFCDFIKDFIIWHLVDLVVSKLRDLEVHS